MRAGESEKAGVARGAREALCVRLLGRREELEGAIAARIDAAAPRSSTNAEYVVGARSAVTTAVECGHDVLAQGHRAVPIPAALLVQARLASRHGVPLETVQRRYYSGFALLSDFCMEESRAIETIGTAELHLLTKDLATFFDGLLAAIATEHGAEARRCESFERGSSAVRIRGLLAGELVDRRQIDYEFDAWHLAVVSEGSAMKERLREAAAALGRRLLVLRHSPDQTWAWLGGRTRLSSTELERTILPLLPVDATLAVGEAGRGLNGWRLSHRQALAALPIAQVRQGLPARYAPNALLASMLQDDLFTASLHQLYLAPLSGERDGGRELRRTLRAYFAAERNVSSAAAALGVSRRTVANRLRVIEARLDRPLSGATAAIEAALMLADLEGAEGRAGPS